MRTCTSVFRLKRARAVWLRLMRGCDGLCTISARLHELARKGNHEIPQLLKPRSVNAVDVLGREPAFLGQALSDY
jgi:hypothetical protein